MLRLFHYHTGGKNSLSLGVHAVTSPWREGNGTYHPDQTEKTAAPGEISWVKQPNFNLSPAASFKPSSKAGQYIDVDITPLVKAWLSGKPNYGLMIKPVGIMSGRAPESSYGFYSREHQDRSKQPVLVLSSASQSQGTAWLLTAKSDRDLVGRNEKYIGNGRFDAVFRAQFSASNRTVTAVEVSNTNGLRSVWDTRPNNRLWLGGVVVGGRIMSRPDGSVNFSLGSGQSTLDFFVEDNGSIKRGKTNYRMTIFFASGDPLTMDITPGGGVAGNLLINPSFEQGRPAGSYLTLGTGSNDLPGWRITQGTIDVVQQYWQSPHGKRSIDLNGTTGAGGLSQVISTIPGQTYTVSFGFTGNPDGGTLQKTLLVQAAGQSARFVFSIKGKNRTDLGWVKRSFTFKARSSKTNLEFISLNTNQADKYFGPVIDNIGVRSDAGSGE